MQLMNPDRTSLLSNLWQQLHQASENKQWVGLLLLDIKDFSNINRLYGIEAGDALIMNINQRLGNMSNQNMHFRLGNDEFAIILDHLSSPENLEYSASQLSIQMSHSFQWQNHNLPIQVNIGACASQTKDGNEQLLLATEHALSQAKKQNLNFYINDIKNQQNIQDDINLRRDFEKALHQNELEIFYQPKIRLKQPDDIYAEALLRWNHPELGFVPPDKFLPICEQLGLNLNLTKWVFNRTLREISQWPKEQKAHVAINASADIIDNPELPEIIRYAINIWGVDPQQLTLEITEKAVIGDMQSGSQNLTKLREMGLNISIDDFGTGYSSLEYFKHIPADELKIDRTFIHHLKTDNADQKLTRIMIELAHTFGLDVVAEGIEDAETLEYLRALGCDFVQGYFIAKPMPFQNFTQWTSPLFK
jgi:diguanylate cyclase (GGDEF)-like protein